MSSSEDGRRNRRHNLSSVLETSKLADACRNVPIANAVCRPLQILIEIGDPINMRHVGLLFGLEPLLVEML